MVHSEPAGEISIERKGDSVILDEKIKITKEIHHFATRKKRLGYAIKGKNFRKLIVSQDRHLGALFVYEK